MSESDADLKRRLETAEALIYELQTVKTGAIARDKCRRYLKGRTPTVVAVLRYKLARAEALLAEYGGRMVDDPVDAGDYSRG